MALYPIWQDVMVESKVLNNPLSYIVQIDGIEVYRGIAQCSPRTVIASFNLSRIVQDYLSSKVTFNSSNFQEASSWRGDVVVIDANNGKTLATHTYYNDWSYKTTYASAIVSLAEPITDYIDYRQRIVTSVGNLTNLSAPITITVGGASRTRVSVTKQTTTTAKLLTDADVGKDVKVLANGRELLALNVRKTSAKYCLYYLNTHGGYDSFLVGGNSMRSDMYERMTIKRNTDTNTLTHGIDTMRNDITSKWQLYTDYLTDAQYQRLHHLLGSTSVYLHDLESDEITPVRVTNNMTDYHTYTNQGRKMSYVRIDVESAQERTRM